MSYILISGRTGGSTTYRLEILSKREFLYRTAFVSYLPETRYFIRDHVYFTVNDDGRINVTKVNRSLLSEQITGWFGEDNFVRTILYSCQDTVINNMIRIFRMDDQPSFKKVLQIRAKGNKIKSVDKEFVRRFYNIYIRHQVEDLIEKFLLTSLDDTSLDGYDYGIVHTEYQQKLPSNGRVLMAVFKYRHAYNKIAEWWEDRYWNPKSPVRKRILMRDLAELNKMTCKP